MGISRISTSGVTLDIQLLTAIDAKNFTVFSREVKSVVGAEKLGKLI